MAAEVVAAEAEVAAVLPQAAAAWVAAEAAGKAAEAAVAPRSAVAVAADLAAPHAWPENGLAVQAGRPDPEDLLVLPAATTATAITDTTIITIVRAGTASRTITTTATTTIITTTMTTPTPTVAMPLRAAHRAIVRSTHAPERTIPAAASHAGCART